jgi:hypothetical protein
MEFEIMNALHIEKCINYIFEIQRKLYLECGPRKVQEFSYLALEDIVNFKSTLVTNQEITILNYIQFYITTHPLIQLVNDGFMNEALVWIGYSLTDDLSDSQVKSFEVIRFDTYLQSTELKGVMNFGEFLQWIGDFYYVCRRLSAYHNIAEDLLGVSGFFLAHSPPFIYDKEFSWGACCITTWAVTTEHQHAKQYTINLEKLLNSSSSSDELKCSVLECFSTIVGKYSSKNSYEWARLALSEYSKCFKGHQKLHFILNSITSSDVDYFESVREALLLELNVVKESIILGNQQCSEVDKYVSNDRLFEMIVPTIGNVMKMNRGSVAINLLSVWYRIDFISSDELLLVYPNNAFSLNYSVGDESMIIERDLKEKYEYLMAVFNDFLGLSHSIRGMPEFSFPMQEPQRMGIPVEKKSKEMEACLLDFFDFKNIENFIESKQSIKSYIAIPSNHHAFQYLSQKYLNTCWPFAVSMQKPMKDRKLLHICLWCGAGSITEEIESNTVKSIFENYNVKVDCFSSAETTKEKFISIYESDTYDVIWVMSHGEFEHWSPGEVSVEIGSGEYISLEEVTSLNVHDNNRRRLLFLNVCDGATHTSMDGLPRLGFAPALSGKQQCVISHLWPVNPWAAATFGAYYATLLCEGGDFFLAFKEALSGLNKNTEMLTETLTAVHGECDELIERITNQSIDFELMIHSGSAVFMQ